MSTTATTTTTTSAAASKTSPSKSGAVKPIPDGMHTVTPHLVCNGAAEAIAFYKKAFNASELARLPAPNGKLIHAAVRIGDSVVMLCDESPECGLAGPKTLKGTPVTLHLYFENVDAAFARATEAGATVTMPLQDMFWGDRYGVVQDPFGHQWSLAMHVRDMTPDEIAQAAQAACG